MWKKELERYEKAQNWPVAIQLLEQVIRKNPVLMEAYVRVIYLLQHILEEEFYFFRKENGELTPELDAYALLLKHYFDASYAKFLDDAEYLFFMGQIITSSPKCFDKEGDTHFALEMQKKAYEKEPHNLLYRWVYLLNSPLTPYLCRDASTEIAWLTSKGYPGACVLKKLQWHYEWFLDERAINKYVVAPHILLISDFINGVLPIKTFNEYYVNMVVGQKHPLADKIAEVIQSLLKDVQACQEQLSGTKTEALRAEALKSHAEKTLIELKILQVAPQ